MDPEVSLSTLALCSQTLHFFNSLVYYVGVYLCILDCPPVPGWSAQRTRAKQTGGASE